MKGPQPHFHSCASSLLRALLHLLDTGALHTSELATAFLHSLKKTCELMVLHSNVGTAQECINILLDKLSESAELGDASLGGLVEVSGCWVGPDRCRLSPDSFDRCVSGLLGLCGSVSDKRESWKRCSEVLVRLVKTNERVELVEVSGLWCRVGEVLRSVNSREEWSVEAGCSMVEGLLSLNVASFSSNVLTSWIEMSERILTEPSAPATIVDRALYSWSLVLGGVEEEGGSGEKRIKLDSSDPFGASLFPMLLERSRLPFSRERAASLSCLCLYAQRVISPPEPALLLIEASLSQLYQLMTSREEALLTTLRDCVQTLVRCRDLTATFPPYQLTSLLSQFPNSPSLLQATDTYARHAALSRDVSEQILALVLPTLSSPYSHIRTHTLSILSAISPHTATLSVCSAAEGAGVDAIRYKERLGQLRRLVHTSGNERGDVELEICFRILVSQFYLNFSPIWDQVRPLVTSYTVGGTNSVFWKVTNC